MAGVVRWHAWIKSLLPARVAATDIVGYPVSMAVEDQLIVADPRVMLGKPVIAGTRVTVESILEKLAEGETIEQVLAAHPRLTREGVRAALRFAAEALRAEASYPLQQTAK